MRATLRALLTGAIDYAGLFPPASLGMEQAVRNYARYRAGEHAWMLGRFVVSAERLEEFASARAQVDSDGPWRTSALCSAADAPLLKSFEERHGAAVKIDAVEIRTASEEAIRSARAAFSPSLALFCELPYDSAPDLLATLAELDAYAKVRTGGTSPEAIPSTEALFGFLQSDIATEVPFKATAGLHHALRGERALTGAGNAPRAVMHGFVNLFVAATVLYTRINDDDAVAILNETDPDAFRFEDDELRWRDRVTIAAERIAEARRLALGFGSCSFEEPVAELQERGWL